MISKDTFTDHLHFHCVEAKQGQFTNIYLGTLKFQDLCPYFTATPRIPRSDDPFYDNKPAPVQQWPQRVEKQERLKEIAGFLRERLAGSTPDKKLTIFPNAIILGLLADIEEPTDIPQNPTPTAAHLLPKDETELRTILLPKIASSLFVIDGQHRLKGLGFLRQQLTEEIAQLKAVDISQNEQKKKELAQLEILLQRLLNFDVLISLLLDFDLKEQAVVFADVNFNQKPVARSYYYDIFGAFESEEFTAIGFCHDLALHLNNSSSSPLKGMIKLLGSGPGLISQAFLVARFILLIDPQSSSKTALRNYLVARQSGDVNASRLLASLVRNYFSAIRNELNYAWPVAIDGKYSARDYKFILCKSMVMSALLALLGDIYRLILLDFAYSREFEVASKDALSPDLLAVFFKKIDSEGRADSTKSIFSKDTAWGIGGSAVLERRIFETLRSKVFGAYHEMSKLPDCPYKNISKQFNGANRALNLALEHTTESEKSFWEKVEAMYNELSPEVPGITHDMRITMEYAAKLREKAS